MKIDKLLIFDLIGTMAHFRKFYTNSSSLSYAFPPRTTITGLIAGILGYPRDSYYEEVSSQNCRIALSIRNPVRKVMQTVNYIRTKSIAEITGSGGHSQIPLEILFPLTTHKELKYRIYFWHKDADLMVKLEKHLKNNTFVFPPYLGITECPGKTSFGDACETPNLEILKNWNKEVEGIVTVIPINQIDKDKFPLTVGYKLMKEDRMPLEFNSERFLNRKSEYLYEKNCQPIKISIKDTVFRVSYKGDDGHKEEWGVFMD